MRPGTEVVNDIICGDQSTNAGTEQTEKTKYERNKNVNGMFRIVESSALAKSLTSALASLEPRAGKAYTVVVATPAARATLVPRRDLNLRGCVVRK